MKTIKTSNYNKKINKKAKKKEKWDPNPWAVCHTTVDKDEEPKKFEECVLDVKKQQKEEDSKKSEKEAQSILTPETEDQFAEEQERIEEKEQGLGFTNKIRSKKPPKVIPQSRRLKERSEIEKDEGKGIETDDDFRNFLREKEKEKKVQAKLKGKVIKV
ncbi:hypothetical protein K9M42_03100 [Patescibacteria group bacterium]|nr:hypothetical protein [Patescibacteria group bacterium]